VSLFNSTPCVYRPLGAQAYIEPCDASQSAAIREDGYDEIHKVTAGKVDGGRRKGKKESLWKGAFHDDYSS
jgi:hypothetical protein